MIYLDSLLCVSEIKFWYDWDLIYNNVCNIGVVDGDKDVDRVL